MPLSLDFAFEGFRIIREKPKLVALWGLVLLIGGGLMQVLLVAIAGADLERFQALIQAQDTNGLTSFMQNAPGRISAAGLAMIPIELVMNAVLSCAVFRAVWGEKDDRFGYLRFGADEWRQVAVQVLLLLVGFGLFFLIGLGAVAIGSAFGNSPQAVSITVAVLVFGLVLGAFVLLRLSLCMAESFDRKRVTIFGSWKLTAKSGWTLLGGYVVAGIMAALVYLLCMIIFTALGSLAGGGGLSAVQHVDMTSLQAYLKLPVIAEIAYVNLVIAPLIAALRFGAQGAAYRTLAGQTPDVGV